ncbi:MAG: LysM peptidoglycan-binding domain-containing protein [Nitrospirae bacterium]|nr:LysM peptidoglycan-binding domain-containing protein [Nitrospirota bacterium]
MAAWLRAALACVLPLLAPHAAWASSVDITDLRTWSAPDNTRLVLDLNGDPSYRVTRESDPERLVVEIRGARPRTAQTSWGPVDGRVSGVTMESTPRGTRVVVALAGEGQFKHFALSPYRDKPYRIVLDVLGPRRETISAAPPEPTPEPVVAPAAPPGRPFVVVVDAGHGGEDPGAIGRYYHTREKDVVLKIARYVREELAAMPGMRPYLTRDGDYFISLGGRVRRADRLQADLFVSIHADTSGNRRTRGTHVYTLAPRSSADRSAVRVARMENASDLVGGEQAAARLPMIFDQNGSPNNVVESRVLSHLAYRRFADLNANGREGRRSEARFWVLKGQRPSILVETGFLSNKLDERELRSEAFQRDIARRVALAVRDYYENRVNPSLVVYSVQPGDTLTRIARRFGVSVADIVRANDVDRASHITVGSRLNVPVRGAGPAPAEVERVADAAVVAEAGADVVDSAAEVVAEAGAEGVGADAEVVAETGADEEMTAEAEARPVALAAPEPETEPTPLVALTAMKAHAADTPKPTLHTVRRGDNPTRIARRHGVRLADLMAANRLDARADLIVGQRLTVPAPRSGDRLHVVAAGETLSGLAQRYDVSLSELARVNDLLTRARLVKGQRVIVPGAGFGARPAPPREHLVRSGESLSGLAQRYGVSLSSLAAANNLSTRARLLKGQRLLVPAGEARSAAPRVHVVGGGDSLIRIARRYDVPVERLRDANRIADADRLLMGRRLVIPD